MVSTLVKIVYLHWNKSTQIAALFLSSFIDVSPNFFNLSETTPMAPWHPIGDTPGGPLNLLQSSRVQHRKGWRLWFPIWHLVQWSQTNCPRISSFIGAAKRQASNFVIQARDNRRCQVIEAGEPLLQCIPCSLPNLRGWSFV